MSSLGRRARLPILLAAATTLCSTIPASASPSPRPPPDPVLALGVDAGGGLVAGEPSLGVEPVVRFRWGDQAADLSAPLRFGLDGRLRARDWDEPGDALRVVRSLRLRAGPVALFGGDLAGLTLGTGALMRGYLGNSDPERHATGLLLRARTDAVDLDLVADRLPVVDVLAARLGIRPAAFAAATPGAARFGLALSVAADVALAAEPGAGAARAEAPSGADLLPPLPPAPRRPGLGALALEAEYLLHARTGVRLAPFVAAAALVSGTGAAGGGLHAGTRASIAFAGAGVTIDLVAAGVLAGPAYLPGAFGPLYRLERAGFPLPALGPVAAGTPPLGAALADLPARGMAFAELAVRARLVEVHAGYASPAGGGTGHRWSLRGALPRVGPAGLALFAAGDDLVPVLAAVEASLRLGWFHLRALASRDWVAEEGAPYRPVFSFWLAAGVSATLAGK